MICANHFFCFDCGLKAYIPLFVESMAYIRLTITIPMAKDIRAYCGICGYDTHRDHEGQDCPYHQRVLSDGTFLYDEFDQDGC